MTLLSLIRTGAKSVQYLCSQLGIDQEELYNEISILQFAGYDIDTFDEGGKIYVFIQERFYQ